MSTIRADYISPSAGGTSKSLVRGTAAAWVNFNGTGTIAARDSENVSSLTDLGTGNYTVNFSNVMLNASYTTQASTWQSVSAVGTGQNVYSPATGFQYINCLENNTSTDPTACLMSIHGDLA